MNTIKEDKEINNKYYETISIKKSFNYDNIIKAMDIVKRFIIREKRVLTGGMSIDFALKLKGHPGVYEKDTIPDYDFYSSTHYEDAYHIAEWLYRTGHRGISVINALHPSTMKIRVDYVAVADITYIPQKIIDAIPTLNYHGFVIIHPHVQMIDQHRALCFPYENAPWETIMVRPKKDMKRYDILYSKYPLRVIDHANSSINLKNNNMPLEIFNSQCISGFLALIHWIQEAKKMGFKTNNNFGHYELLDDMIKYSIPVDSHGISLYSDNMEELYKLLISIYKPKEQRFYNRFLDKLPRKIILDNEWEILDNKQKIAAHKISMKKHTVYIANLQTVMLYLLTNYIVLIKLKGIKRGHSFYLGYLECRNLITWAANKYYNLAEKDKKSFALFLPTAETYGAKNESESYIVGKHKFDIKNKTISVSEKDKYSQPSNVYDRDIRKYEIPKSYFEFDRSKSEIFQFDGEETTSFY